MTKSLLSCIAAALIVVGCNAEATQPPWAGVWGIWGTHVYSASSYMIKGSVVSAPWDAVEATQDTYTWTKIDKCKTAITNGQYCGILVYIDTPAQWLYNLGVPEVETTTGDFYPYYLNTTYQTHVQDLWNDLKGHIDSTYTTAQKAKIVFFQVPLGKSGDKGPYNGTPLNSAYNITDAQWTQYQKDMIDDAFAVGGYGTDYPLLFNITDDVVSWIETNYAGDYGLKGRNIAQMHQMNTETNQNVVWDKCKAGVLCRGEFDGAVKNNAGWYSDNRASAYYWGALWALHNGLDTWQQRTQTWNLGTAVYTKGFTLMNRYAGYSDPETTKYAWIYFRDGLDQNDTTRFPTGTYGALNSAARYSAILGDFTSKGAAQDDVTNQHTFPMAYVRNLDGLNDVAHQIWADDYYQFAERISGGVGRWRVDFDPTQPMGRWARQCATNGYIYIDLDDALFGTDGKNINPIEDVEITVSFHDFGTTTWELRGDLQSGSDKLVGSHTNGASYDWDETTFILDSQSSDRGYFGNRGPNGADLWIKCTSGTTVFHGIEVKFQDRDV